MSRAATLPRRWTDRYVGSLRISRRAAVLVGLVVLSRVLNFELGGLAYVYLLHAWPQVVPGYLPPSGPFWFQVLLGPWAHWDGYWYLSIAHLGYAGRRLATAFFPLYPLMIAALGGSVLSAVAIALAFFGAGLWVLYRLAEQEVGATGAWFAVVALAFFPTAFYFNAVYPESLMLFLSMLSLYWAKNGKWGLAAAAAGLMSATSIDGFILALPLALYLWRQRAPWRQYAWIALTPAGLLVYMARLWQVFGNPLMFQSVQTNWGRHFDWPWSTLWSAVKNAWLNLGNVVSLSHLFATGQPTDQVSNVWNLIFFAAAVWLVVLAYRRLDRPIWLYCVAVLAVPFLDPSSGVPFMSMPRFLLDVAPLFIGLGAWLSTRMRAFKVYLGLSWAVGAILVALFTTFHWVA